MKLKKLFILPIVLLASLTSCKDKNGSGTGGQSTPNQGADVCVNNNGTLLSSVNAGSVGTAFSGKVIVSGIKGTDLYVEDSSGAGFVYTKGSLDSSIKIGDLINLSGTISLYQMANIYQITEPTITLEGTSCGLKDPAKVTLSQMDAYRMGRVSIDNLEVTSIAKFKTGSEDSFITVKDSTGSYDIYISKRLDSTVRASIDTALSAVTVGTKLNIVGAFADYFKSPQISITDVSQIVLS